MWVVKNLTKSKKFYNASNLQPENTPPFFAIIIEGRAYSY